MVRPADPMGSGLWGFILGIDSDLYVQEAVAPEPDFHWSPEDDFYHQGHRRRKPS